MTDGLSDEVGRGVKRAEWGVILSLGVSAATALFTGGVVYGQVQANAIRLDKVEIRADSNATTIAQQAVMIARIDANVGFLAEEARARRAASGR